MVIMKRINSLICISLLLVVMGCTLFKPNEAERLGTEEHAIISAVLDSILQQQYPLENIDVYDLTSTATNTASLTILFERNGVDSTSLLDNYIDANRIRYALDIDDLPDYVVLKDALESDPYSGYMDFSCPGISDDGLMAVVEYSSISAPLAGCGMAVLLEKLEGEWHIVWIEMIWVS
jgi:hypothetical protein